MTDERAQRIESMHKTLCNASDVFRKASPFLRSRQIISPSLGQLGLHLGSLVSTDRGLDLVTYFVVDPQTRFAISMGNTKDVALSMARDVVQVAGPARICAWSTQYHKDCHAVVVAQREQFEAQRQAQEAETQVVRSIPRPRRQIFEKAGGACHYCKTVLTLDGKWHIEHKLPKALGGDNHPDNLTAACPSCNLKKRDLTDTEFLQQIEGGSRT